MGRHKEEDIFPTKYTDEEETLDSRQHIPVSGPEEDTPKFNGTALESEDDSSPTETSVSPPPSRNDLIPRRLTPFDENKTMWRQREEYEARNGELPDKIVPPRKVELELVLARREDADSLPATCPSVLPDSSPTWPRPVSSSPPTPNGSSSPTEAHDLYSPSHLSRKQETETLEDECDDFADEDNFAEDSFADEIEFSCHIQEEIFRESQPLRDQLINSENADEETRKQNELLRDELKQSENAKAVLAEEVSKMCDRWEQTHNEYSLLTKESAQLQKRFEDRLIARQEFFGQRICLEEDDFKGRLEKETSEFRAEAADMEAEIVQLQMSLHEAKMYKMVSEMVKSGLAITLQKKHATIRDMQSEELEREMANQDRIDEIVRVQDEAAEDQLQEKTELLEQLESITAESQYLWAQIGARDDLIAELNSDNERLRQSVNHGRGVQVGLNNKLRHLRTQHAEQTNKANSLEKFERENKELKVALQEARVRFTKLRSRPCAANAAHSRRAEPTQHDTS